MILKGFVTTLVFSIGWIKSVAGAPSYSNVYVQSGPSLASLYGPAALTGAQLAPLAASPLMSNVLPPCVSPCVIPNQRIAALAPVATSSSNFVSYKSPISIPIVVAPTNDDAASYEYSYVVYDEDTGDQKAQKELSENGVVRGQYSLVQPDGYVREVQYTADDLRGFNAVVKNFLPKYALNIGTEGKALPPCPEVKNEPLKESSSGEAHDLEPEAHPQETHGNEGHVEPVESKNENTHEESHEGAPKPVGHGEATEPKEPAKFEEVKPKAESHGDLEGKVEPKGHELQEKSETLEAKVEPIQVIPKEPETPHGAEKGNEEKKEEVPKSKPGLDVIPAEINALVSYNDVIKCIQTAIKGVAPTASPLTYIVLNKPC